MLAAVSPEGVTVAVIAEADAKLVWAAIRRAESPFLLETAEMMISVVRRVKRADGRPTWTREQVDEEVLGVLKEYLLERMKQYKLERIG